MEWIPIKKKKKKKKWRLYTKFTVPEAHEFEQNKKELPTLIMNIKIRKILLYFYKNI